MNFPELKAELENDPASIGYATMSVEQVQIALAGNPIAVTRNVPLDALQAFLMSTMQDGSPVPAWWVIKSSAAMNPVAEMAFDLFTSRLQSLDTMLPTVQGLLAQLVTTGVLAQGVSDQIVAMANVQLSRGEALFGSVPTILEIQFARLD